MERYIIVGPYIRRLPRTEPSINVDIYVQTPKDWSMGVKMRNWENVRILPIL